MNICCVVLNWNGIEDSIECIKALNKQTTKHTIIAVDNGSNDSFVQECRAKYPGIEIIENEKNLGFAGGVNTGIRYALENHFDYVALINNDARPEPTWLEQLFNTAQGNMTAGIVTGRLLRINGTIDSTGDIYSTWGLPFPRGRDEKDVDGYSTKEFVFGATGGASLYRAALFEDIGLFDEDFFAYYEDVDLSFRAQLAGWKVVYTPLAIAHHKVGATSSKIPGFTTYQTIKNLPMLFWKNVPLKLMPRIFPRFFITHSSIVFSSLVKGKIAPTLKGLLVSIVLFPKKFVQRLKIQRERRVTDAYIKSILFNDLPPTAERLRRLRSFFVRNR